MSHEPFAATRAELQALRDRTNNRDIREQLASIDEALSERDEWEDESERRLTEIRRQLAEMEARIDPELRGEVQTARESLHDYQIEHFDEGTESR